MGIKPIPMQTNNKGGDIQAKEAEVPGTIQNEADASTYAKFVFETITANPARVEHFKNGTRKWSKDGHILEEFFNEKGDRIRAVIKNEEDEVIFYVDVPSFEKHATSRSDSEAVDYMSKKREEKSQTPLELYSRVMFKEELLHPASCEETTYVLLRANIEIVPLELLETLPGELKGQGD